MIKEESGYRLIYVDNNLYRGSCVFVVKLYHTVDLTGTSRMKPKKVEKEYADVLLEQMDFIKEYEFPTKEEVKEYELEENCRYEEYSRAELIRLASKRGYETAKEGRSLTTLKKQELVDWHISYDEKSEI